MNQIKSNPIGTQHQLEHYPSGQARITTYEVIFVEANEAPWYYPSPEKEPQIYLRSVGRLSYPHQEFINMPLALFKTIFKPVHTRAGENIFWVDAKVRT